jgi:hypothetical protein
MKTYSLYMQYHPLLSFIRLFLFILFLQAGLGISRCQAQELKPPSDPSHGPIPPYRLAAQIGGNFKIILGGAAQWAPFTAAGVAVDFPTYLEKFSFRLAADGGILKALPTAAIVPQYQRGYIIQCDLSIVYALYLAGLDVTLRPRAGIANTTLYFSGSTAFRDFDITASAGNVFGPLLGVEALIHIYRFTIALPITFTFVLSAPKRTTIFSTSLYLGGVLR